MTDDLRAETLGLCRIEIYICNICNYQESLDLGVLSQWYCCCREEISLLHRPCCREGEIDVVVLEAVVYVVEDLDEGFGEGAAVDDGLLGAADFGGRDELHGFGDLLDVLHGVDSLPQFSEAATDSRWGSAKCGLDGGAGGDGGGENGQ
ncbi:hypothetical protein TIFTF001_053551 [Ficus carica]|uniref:Uncharacterized protein n=2 Tax=Ficus carica TaxID=3494 RepID=A0AA88ED70_FICCA|nr:hypothetical protein TIFTF001_053551 [Ficus carica]